MGVPLATHAETLFLRHHGDIIASTPWPYVHARTGVQGDHLGLPVRQFDVEHKRVVLDPDLHPLVLNERAVLVEHHPVPALDHPGSGRQRLPDLSHVEFDRTGAGHLPVLVCFNREHLEPPRPSRLLQRARPPPHPLPRRLATPEAG